MGAFKLETFEITARNGGLGELRNSVLERERNEAYASGFKDGVNVTKNAVDVEHNARLASIDEALADLGISHEEASVALTRSLAPLLQQFLTAIAPTVAVSAFARTVAEQIGQAVRDASRPGVRVVVACGAREQLADELRDRAIEVAIEEDPALAPLAAEVHWDGGVDVADMTATLSEVTARINAHLGTSEEETEDDRRNAG